MVGFEAVDGVAEVGREVGDLGDGDEEVVGGDGGREVELADGVARVSVRMEGGTVQEAHGFSFSGGFDGAAGWKMQGSTPV